MKDKKYQIYTQLEVMDSLILDRAIHKLKFWGSLIKSTDL